MPTRTGRRRIPIDHKTLIFSVPDRLGPQAAVCYDSRLRAAIWQSKVFRFIGRTSVQWRLRAPAQ